MTDIAHALDGAAARGLKSLTLWQTPDGRWQANASYDRVAWSVEFDPDPSVALARVLGLLPGQSQTYVNPSDAQVSDLPTDNDPNEDIFA